MNIKKYLISKNVIEWEFNGIPSNTISRNGMHGVKTTPSQTEGAHVVPAKHFPASLFRNPNKCLGPRYYRLAETGPIGPIRTYHMIGPKTGNIGPKIRQTNSAFLRFV